MTRNTPPGVKICGLRRREDAEAAAFAGADYLGVILAPGFRRTVAPEAAGEILADLPGRHVGVFVDNPVDEMLRAARLSGVHVLQLHGDETPEALHELRAAGYTVWKALRPRGGGEFADGVARYADVADALLLDGWSPESHGGTGARFPWREVAALRDVVPDGVRLVVAGGLRAENVAEAAALLRPDLLDVSSGVEASVGIKDPAAVRAFVAAVRSIPVEPVES